jgi:hypothetical protein
MDREKKTPTTKPQSPESQEQEKPASFRTVKDESKKAFLDRLIKNGWSDVGNTGSA